ncbi:L,D-transpeptidase family protein [Gammaproteobacteria bacterium]|nr:L,D-transpeptidase family protein [Gammaproteobacteria bacterium]
MQYLCLTVMIPLISLGQMYQINPHSDLIGETYHLEISSNIRLENLAKKQKVGFRELKIANPNIQSIVRKGDTVVIPAMYVLPPEPFRSGIVINTAEPRLYYFSPNGDFVFTTPIAVGRSGWRTPLFSGTIINKKPRPSWTPPSSIKDHYLKKYNKVLPDVIPPGPDNPLGNYALYTSEPRILIHGTNNEYSIGKYASSGCIRLYNQDIQTLFRLIDAHTPVTIVHIPIKVGYHQGNQYIEAHPEILNANHDSPFNIHIKTFDVTPNGIPTMY